ncbi:SHOCT-like domain-containing protein [Priestia aryabhattai]
MSEKRKQILQMVEEGKLSVDEALTLLNSLEKDSANDSSYATPDKAELSPYVGGKQKKTYASKSSQSSLKEKLFTFVDQTVKK